MLYKYKKQEKEEQMCACNRKAFFVATDVADYRRSDDTILRIWDSAMGECTAALEGHFAGVWSVAFFS